MLEGIRTNEIIVGAYTEGHGICPMLAAHRAGGRTNLISFARAWDRFALGHGRSKRVRRASERELRVLVAQLEASLLEDSLPGTELAAAIADHRRLEARRRERAEAAARSRAGALRAKGLIRIYRRRELEGEGARRALAGAR